MNYVAIDINVIKQTNQACTCFTEYLFRENYANRTDIVLDLELENLRSFSFSEIIHIISWQMQGLIWKWSWFYGQWHYLELDKNSDEESKKRSAC